MRVSSLLLLCSLALPLCGQTTEFWPGAQYDPAIPTVKQVLGHEPGERIAPPDEIQRYFEALAKAAPERMRIHEYARTWEGRRLIYAVIASPANIQKLDSIQAGMQKLYDPRKTTPQEAKQLIDSMPAVLNLSYGVHGNEISSPDASMMTAYHLLAAKEDELVEAFYRDVVLLIDPIQNPDGRNRFVHNFRVSEGIEPDPSPNSAERAEPWPGGRSNHYFFDMNRDWFALTQPETLGRVRYLREWWPVALVDLHEMGTESSYFFPPGSEPFNPHVSKSQLETSATFGKNNAKWFDQFGYTYFTREVFDEFYPGYGSAWPWFYGGIGMTYENASVRGLAARRLDGSIYRYPDSVRKHFIASIASCETASVQRRALLENFYRYHVNALEEGAKDAVKEYILARRGDVSAVDKLAHILAEQGVEVNQAKAAFKNGGKDYPAGSYLAPLAQPRRMYVHSLLDRDVPLTKEFAAEQERRRKKRLPDQIYDVTGWSLPLLYNVECVAAAEASKVETVAVTGPYTPRGTVSGKAKVSYLVPWGTQAAGRFLTAALRQDLKLTTVGKSFTQNGREFPAGTLAALVSENGDGVNAAVAKLAEESGAEVVATDSGWTEGGINLGSNYAYRLRKPVIALLWDSPMSSESAGNTRYVIERQFHYPVTAVRGQAFASADLSQFQVIILPDSYGNYASVLSPPVVDRLKVWVRNGGSLVAFGGAMAALANPQVGLLAVQQESLAHDAAKAAEGAKPAGGSAAPAGPSGGGGAPSVPSGPPGGSGPVAGKILAKAEDYDKAIQPESPLPDPVQGVLVKAKTDPETWVTAGVAPTLHFMLNGSLIFTPVKLDRGVNAVTFAGPDELLESGYLWDENRKQLAYKPVVVIQNEGRGWVTGFAAEPTFRGFMDGLNVLLLNAVFRAPTGARGYGQAEVQ